MRDDKTRDTLRAAFDRIQIALDEAKAVLESQDVEGSDDDDK